jgi:hypothetical protein
MALLGTLALLLSVSILATSRGRNLAWSAFTRLRGRATVESRLAEIGPGVRPRLAGAFAAAGLAYPPRCVGLLAFKEERRFEVHAAARPEGPWRHALTYAVLGASGELGPKLAEGDLQVPEGIYRIESLNPNSRFHLALRVGYPNELDRARARADGRSDLGGDIMVHGGRQSIGCIALGDPAIEDLFVLAADAGPGAVELVIAPRDLRSSSTAGLPSSPIWVADLYSEIAAALARFP